MALAAVFLVVLFTTPAVFAKDYPITWNLNGDYSSWATTSLNEGDRLVFTYDGTHSVDVVSKSDYDSCNAAGATQSNSNSPTTITLKAGTTYIICGTPGHCSSNGGMKLQVTAKATSGGSTPSATPTPAGGSPATPASGGTGSTPTPTPSGNGVAGSLSGAHLSFGLGLGALVALLG